MSVIVELSLPAAEFQLGRILQVEGDTRVHLETVVPLGNRPVPFFRLRDGRTSFEKTVRGHDAVDEVHVVDTRDGEALYALDWEIKEGALFDTIAEERISILETSGDADAWAFELRMPSHDALSEFQQYCFDADTPLNIRRIYNPTRPNAGPWYGLTTRQRKALTRAVEEGYYSIPRRTSTETLADEFDISDQAVTERLRRAIDTLVRNTLLLTEENESGR